MAALEQNFASSSPGVPIRPVTVKWYLSIPPTVILALVVTAVVSVLVFGGSEMAFSQLTESRRQLWDLVDGRAELLKMQRDITVAESAQRGFLMTDSTRYLRPFEQSSEMAAFTHSIVLTKVSSVDNLRIQAVALGRTLQKKLDELNITVQLALSGDKQKALEVFQSDKGLLLMEQIVRDSRKLDEDILNQTRTIDQEMDNLLWRQRVGTGILVTLNLLFMAALAGRTVKYFHERELQRQHLSDQTAELEAAVQARTEELRTLTTYIQKQSERDKSQLAHDLHDEFGPLLTAAKLDVAWLQGRNPGDDSQSTERLERLSAELDDAVDLKRRVIESLRPSLLQHLGLASALQWYVQECCDKAGLKYNLNVPEVTSDKELGLTLYRIVQEALNNTLKHARAQQVQLDLSETADTLEMTIQDDGIGILHFRPDHLSHGLAGMRHRVQSHGGDLTITTSHGAGTKLTVVLPKSKPDISDTP